MDENTAHQERTTALRTAGDLSTPDLVKQLGEQISTLVHSEVDLAKAELRRTGGRYSSGARLYGGAGAAALYGGGALTAFAVLGLTTAMGGWGWLAALIVAAALLAAAAVLARLARQRLDATDPAGGPERALSGLKQDIETVRKGFHP